MYKRYETNYMCFTFSAVSIFTGVFKVFDECMHLGIVTKLKYRDNICF